MNKKLIAVLVFGITLISTSIALCASQAAENGRKIVESYKDTVVTVKLVVEIKTSYEGNAEKEEEKLSTPATVIDPSGLTVAPLSAIEPKDYFSEHDNDAKYTYSTEVKDARIRLSDGTEILADVVLRDRDLDMAFIKPQKSPDKPMAAIDLTQSGEPKMLDQIVVLSRLGQIASYSIAANIDTIQAVVTKPRLFYVTYSPLNEGGPVFTEDGKVIGITFWREAQADDDNEYGDSIPIILPCSTILQTAKQALSKAK